MRKAIDAMVVSVVATVVAAAATRPRSDGLKREDDTGEPWGWQPQHSAVQCNIYIYI